MDALVAGAAPEPGGEAHYRRLLAAASFVVGADAGAEWCVELGRIPDLAVGDFDSARSGAVERLAALGVEVVTFPAHKDASDLDLAVAEIRRRGAERVTLTAVASLRLDHTLAGLGALASCADLEGSVDEPSFQAWALDAAVRPHLELAGRPGDLVSVFAFGGPAEGVTLTGMRYPLRGARLEPFSSHGLSNEMASDEASVAVGSGRLLVIATGTASDRAHS